MIDNPFQTLDQELAKYESNALVSVGTINKLIAACKAILPIAGDGIKVESNQDGRKISLTEKATKQSRGATGSFKVCVHDPAWSGEDNHYSRTIKWEDGLIKTSGQKEIHIYTQDTHTVEAGHEPVGDGEIGGGSESGDGEYGYTYAARAMSSDKATDFAL